MLYTYPTYLFCFFIPDRSPIWDFRCFKTLKRNLIQDIRTSCSHVVLSPSWFLFTIFRNLTDCIICKDAAFDSRKDFDMTDVLLERNGKGFPIHSNVLVKFFRVYS